MGGTGIMIKYVGAECPTFIKMDSEKVTNMADRFLLCAVVDKQQIIPIETEKDVWFINLERVEYVRFIREQ
ncbi:hypothetical protein [Geobacillus stearothermophilus]|uniref:hypothetical protein n=1 Tax=Geobacillus stearothermophilus TaxID=1422 RepID=UPI003D1A4FAB